MKLNALAEPFFPQFNESEYSTQSTGIEELVCLNDMESYPPLEILDDDDLFDISRYPATFEEIEELEIIDEVNEMFAELDLLEMQEELYQRLLQKRKDIECRQDAAVTISNALFKSWRQENSRSFRCKGSIQKRNGKKTITRVQQP